MKIYPYYFFIAFAVGILISYITLPPKDIIFKNPTAGEVAVQVDQENCQKTNTCYRYKKNPNLVH